MAQAHEPEAMAPLSLLMAEQWTLGCVTTDHALASRWSNVAGSPPGASVKRHFCNMLGKRFPGGYVGNSFLLPSR